MYDTMYLLYNTMYLHCISSQSRYRADTEPDTIQSIQVQSTEVTDKSTKYSTKYKVYWAEPWLSRCLGLCRGVSRGV